MLPCTGFRVGAVDLTLLPPRPSDSSPLPISVPTSTSSPPSSSPRPLSSLSPQTISAVKKSSPAAKKRTMALAEALEIGIRIAYLDRSEVGSGDVINWVEFGKATAEEDKPLTLLYR
jgi:hypothetical protein